LYWITRVMVVYGHMPVPAAVAVNGALIAYLALFPAAFGAVVARLTNRGGPRMVLWAPFVWVASELGRTYLLTGFPWVLLGYSQTSVLPIAQTASVVGVYGLSAVVASTSAALAFAATVPRDGGERNRRPPIWRSAFRPLLIVLLVLVVLGVWGEWRIGRGELVASGETLRVGLIQANVSIEEKLETRQAFAIFTRYLRLSREALAKGATTLIWPESSTPFAFGLDLTGSEQVRALARDAHASILLGSDQVQYSDPPQYWNSAFMIRPDGSTAGNYKKIHLVPFGEYVPARRVFFFMDRIVEASIDFSSGLESTLLPIGSHQVSTSICYEVVYPNLVRQFTIAGSELLTTITNDAWFGPTSAPYQHFDQAAMRAIENGRYLVRAANTGVSGIVDPYGRVLMRSGIFEPRVLVGEVRFLHGMTWYARLGDAIAYASLLITAALLVVARRSYRMT
jgi:apolipoprotein N-acyltransferase